MHGPQCQLLQLFRSSLDKHIVHTSLSKSTTRILVVTNSVALVWHSSMRWPEGISFVMSTGTSAVGACCGSSAAPSCLQ